MHDSSGASVCTKFENYVETNDEDDVVDERLERDGDARR